MFLEKLVSHKTILTIVSIVVHRKDKKKHENKKKRILP